MGVVKKIKDKVLGEWQPTQVFDAGYTRHNAVFLQKLDDLLRPNKNDKEDYKLRWRTDHWELRANRRLSDDELATLRTRYDDTK